MSGLVLLAALLLLGELFSHMGAMPWVALWDVKGPQNFWSRPSLPHGSWAHCPPPPPPSTAAAFPAWGAGGYPSVRVMEVKRGISGASKCWSC